MHALGRGWLRGRRAAVSVFGLFVVVVLVLVFGGTLTRSTQLEAEADRLRAEIAALEDRVAMGEAEIRFYESDAFVRWQARAYGLGRPGETRFALPLDAPSPEPLVPLGPADAGAAATTPLEAWLELLFGG